jgi:hypothetical protein
MYKLRELCVRRQANLCSPVGIDRVPPSTASEREHTYF